MKVTMLWKVITVKIALSMGNRAKMNSVFNASCANLGFILIVLVSRI